MTSCKRFLVSSASELNSLVRLAELDAWLGAVGIAGRVGPRDGGCNPVLIRQREIVRR